MSHLKKLSQEFLTADQVAQRYNISKSTVWRWHSKNQHFPKPCKFSENCTRWKLSDLLDYEASLKECCNTAFPSPYDREAHDATKLVVAG